MPSPFPGMNPYLEQEQTWRDFHTSFIPAAREIIAKQVRPAYLVKVEEHLYVHNVAEEGRRLMGVADLGVRDAGRASGSPPGAGVAMLEAPAELVLPFEVERDTNIEIWDRAGDELVTVLELLSPTNKRAGDKREQYLAKRAQLLTSTTHFVEIDLLRGGPRMPPEEWPDCDYYAMVSRVEQRPRAGIWPLRLRDPLPVIPIPLRPPHADARLDLKEVLDRVYDAAGYEDYVYDGVPQPPLHPNDAAWARLIIER